MKFKVIVALLLICELKTFAQPTQPKSFYVNACHFYGSFETELQSLCKGFNVIIEDNKINIGEDDWLYIKSKEYDKLTNQTKYFVTDPKNGIMGCFIGKTKSGEDYIQLVFKNNEGDKTESGLVLQYWSNVSSYDFWKYERMHPYKKTIK